MSDRNVRFCRGTYEPSVAESTFDSMVEEHPSIILLKSHRFQSTITRKETACGVVVQDRGTGVQKRLPARLVIDATYEGDAYASAGARYRLGRESRDESGTPRVIISTTASGCFVSREGTGLPPTYRSATTDRATTP